MKNPLKVCLAASSGGHLTELLTLSESWRSHETFCITTVSVVQSNLERIGEVYVVGECNRQHPIRVLRTLLRCANVLFKERPDVVLSTGAAAGCMVCFMGKLLGAKVVWMDSITNVERISLSGRMVRHIADIFLVQWSKLAKQYSNVEYVGTVI
jgi:UDP-N-acetylglucosamine:LPS N-acetylglucosamine transferase